jgi:Fe-S-cluster-containing dehydrogenase component
MNMDRRKFIQTGLAAGGLVVVSAATAPKLVHAASTPKNAMLVVVGNCIGCDHCVVACNQYHSGLNAPGTTFTGLLPTSNAYTKVAVVGAASQPYPQNCMQCTDAPCATVCQTHALTQLASGTVTYDANECIGCFECTTVCPFGSITADRVNKKIGKCTFCDRITEAGGVPFCVQICPGKGPDAKSKTWGPYQEKVDQGLAMIATGGQAAGGKLLYQQNTATLFVLSPKEYQTFIASPEVTVLKAAYPTENKTYSSAVEWVRLAWIPLLAGVAFYALKWRDGGTKPEEDVKKEKVVN